jgi:fused signal recognition particle receptor
VAAPAPAEAAPPVEKPKALKEGLAKTRSGFVSRIGGLLGKKQIDAQLVEQLEEILFTADIGGKTSAKLFEAVRASLSRNELKDADAVWGVIRAESEKILAAAAAGAGPIDFSRAKPFVILTIGVNGVGKTTTIGKLAAKYAASGKRVLLAAGDTFRAAATEQLEVWGARTGAPVVKGKEGADPSSVIFDGVKRAEAEGYDILIADTAGRLHTKTELMQELQKVRRVVQKAMPSAPHETLLVLDATNGQNAIAQATLFKQAMDITGIVLTKLDGTAKGGVILGICDELKVPVRYIGIGEKVADLREFDSAEFVSALYDHAESAA